MDSNLDLTGVRWRKSTYSGNTGGDCVEASFDLDGVVPVRDSKTAAGGPVLVFGTAAWTEFVGAVGSADGGVR
ncbi:DUF397 domain-containing protein [Streptomyces mangrovisoli]|uniref:DUF397 domain-containing protein n=1 Tax=Streptomyces mangrovisoli TaxID=1428628 RepID=A0A1J4P7U7_9ACTN|nr:DUF397 domain-containing protein [Streptomyces mangrovisoli]OIJ69581.1 hypothetical protein WN71_001470 [Streptomyces mangrovisoli]